MANSEIPPSGIQTSKISSVPREKNKWLWPGRLLVGAINNLTGDPGIGKGMLVAHSASMLTTGRLLPGMDQPIDPINVLILAEEDAAGSVLRPRLEDMGADLDRVYIYEGYIEKSGRSAQFDISKIGELKAKIKELQVQLVVLDPLLDFLGLTDINKAEKVKEMLIPLARLAKDLDIAIVCIIHCNKAEVKALYKGSGSMQFAGKARSVLFVDRSPENDLEKVLCQVKSNYGPIAPSLTYRIEGLNGDHDKPILVWNPLDEGRWTADGLLAASGFDAKGISKIQLATAILKSRLTSRPCPTTEMESLFKEFGVSDATQRRAREDLGVESKQYERQWVLSLPGYEPPDEHESLSPKSGHISNEKLDKLLDWLVKIHDKHEHLSNEHLSTPQGQMLMDSENPTDSTLESTLLDPDTLVETLREVLRQAGTHVAHVEP